jgi:hypothetical protein
MILALTDTTSAVVDADRRRRPETASDTRWSSDDRYMEPYLVDNGTPAPPDGILFSAMHVTSEDRAEAESHDRASGQRRPVWRLHA